MVAGVVTQTGEAADGASAGDAAGRVAALDGVRGIAIVAVMLFHGGVSWAAGGFLGVDVFFVLSGYLITSQLVREVGTTNTVSIGKFWLRRVRRLIPAAYVVIAAVAAWTRFVGPIGGTDIRGDVASALGFVSNWKFISQQTDYFARTATPSPLQHTWSLAVEAQFYVFWPFFVLGAMRLVSASRGRRAYAHHARRPSAMWPPELVVAAVAAVGVAASAAAMALLYHQGGDPTRVYFGTDTRVQAILVGAFIAAVFAAAAPGDQRATWSSAARGTLDFVGVVAGVGILVACNRFDGNSASLYRGGFALVAALTAAVIAVIVLVPDGLISRIMAWRPLSGLGKISYGVYLWHWPVFLILTRSRTGIHGWPLFGLRCAATLELALMSWVLIEKPILERKRDVAQPWRRVLAPLGVATAVAAMTLSPAAVAASASGDAVNESATKSAPVADPNVVPLAPSNRPKRHYPQPAKVEIIGDSVALTLANGVGLGSAKYGVTIINDGILGCGISVGGPYRYFGSVTAQRTECDQWQRTWLADVARADADVVVVLVGRWEVMDRVVNGDWHHIGEAPIDNMLRAQLELAYKAASVRGAVVAFATAPYYLRGERPDGGRWPEDDPARVNRFNQLLREVAAKHPGRVRIIDFNKKTGPNGVYQRVVSGVGLRSDGVHFTPQGDRWLQPWLLPQLESFAPPALGAPVTTTTSTTLRYAPGRTTVTSSGRSQGATTAPDARVR